MIFFSNPKQQNQKYKKEIIKSIIKVFNSNKYILDNEVKKLESKFSKFINTKYCLGVANGTEALELSLRTLNIGKGDEVISVAHTAPATISAIYSVGSTPILIDVEDQYYTLDSTLLEKAITKKTKCLILVHLYGMVADIEKIKKICKKKSIYLIEDASQAHGSLFNKKRIGSFGEIGCFSCYPTKNLGAIGDAGLIVTNSKKYYNKMKMLRQYGWNQKKIVNFPGYNSRLDELQAAILNVKLKYLDKDNKIRRRIANFYDKNIKNDKFIKPRIRKNSLPVFHLYVLQCENRKKFLNYMRKNKIICGIHYETPAHKHKGYKTVKISGDLNITNKICKKVVSLPIYPELTIRELNLITNLINKF